MGGLYLFSLPIILIFAVLATISLARAFWGGPQSRRWGRIALVLVLAALCWSPIALMGFGIVRGVADGLARNSNPATWGK